MTNFGDIIFNAIYEKENLSSWYVWFINAHWYFSLQNNCMRTETKTSEYCRSSSPKCSRGTDVNTSTPKAISLNFSFFKHSFLFISYWIYQFPPLAHIKTNLFRQSFQICMAKSIFLCCLQLWVFFLILYLKGIFAKKFHTSLFICFPPAIIGVLSHCLSSVEKIKLYLYLYL